jgi:protein-L-isoaspartate(D-aspartate) O-methyltransferase
MGRAMIVMFRTAYLVVTAALSVAHSIGAEPRDSFETARKRMVDEEIIAAGVADPRVIKAMQNTPRHEFIPREQSKYAYYDMALPIGNGQTISPPFVVAYMTEQLDPQASDRVLEIGTGSGYQAAVLSGLVHEVYTVEIVEPLGRRAAQTLKRLKYQNVHVKIGDGFEGWPEHAPFDKIVVTCSPERVPAPLVEQLKTDGLMVVPVGERYQQTLNVFRKERGQLAAKALLPTLFVPMTGTAERQRHVRPDPLSPAIQNGSFEVRLNGTDQPQGWHYTRQMSLMEDAQEARNGMCYATFHNDHPGRGSQALQGFAIDGRSISHLDVSLWVRGDALRGGLDADEWPRLMMMFYDQSRAAVGKVSLGPWKGTFGWRHAARRLPVPLHAREAIVRVGLLGAVGRLAVDDVRIEPVRD